MPGTACPGPVFDVRMSNPSPKIGRRTFLLGGLLGGIVVHGVGCESIPMFDNPKKGTVSTPLREMPVASNAVGVEIFTIRVPYADRAALQSLWQETNEQDIPALVRRDLLNNGIRVGIQGIGISSALSKLIALKSRESTVVTALGPGEMSAAELASEPLVARFAGQMPANKSFHIKPYQDRLPEVPLFWSEQGRTCGASYQDAIGVLVVSAKPLGDGYILFQTTPVLQYGDSAKLRYGFDQGIATRGPNIPTRSFEHLTTSVRLLPGHWLLIGPAMDNPNGIGRYFFTRDFGDTEQKLIAIRLTAAERGDP